MDDTHIDPTLRQCSAPPGGSWNDPAFEGRSGNGGSGWQPNLFAPQRLHSEPPHSGSYRNPSPYPYAGTHPGPIRGSAAQRTQLEQLEGLAPASGISPSLQTTFEPPPQMIMPPPPAPLPPVTGPYTSVSGTAFGRENVVREFTVIRTEIQHLQQEMRCIQQENRALVQQNKSLRDYIEKTGRGTHRKVEHLERTFATTVATIQTLPRESDHHGRHDDEDGVLESLPPKAKEEEEKAKHSKTAAKSNEIKALVREIFKIFLGITKLNETDELPVIGGAYDRNSLPFVRGSDELRQVRFYWNRDLRDRQNRESLTVLVEHAKSRGSDLVQDVGKFLAVITTPDLRKVFEDQFNRLKKVAKGTHIKKEEDGATINKNRDTRAKGKLEVRLRKREVLPNDHEYRNTKYDAAYAYQLLSDDEDAPVVNPNEPRVFISRAPVYRSKLLNDMWDAIDAIPDPLNPRQYTIRQRGEPIEKIPVRTKGLEGRLRRWMVDPDWLAEHPEANNEDMIAENGRLWGDAEDPEETMNRLKKAAADKKGQKRKAGVEGPSASKPPPQKSMRRTRSQTKKLQEVQEEELHSEDDFFDQ